MKRIPPPLRPIRPLLLCFALAGCSVGPDYRRPAVELPAGWRADAASAAASGAPAALRDSLAEGTPPLGDAALIDSAWWSAFGDPQLDALVQTALAENKDLQIAAFRIQQFDASLQVSKSAGLPQVSAGMSRSRDTLSQNRQLPLVAGAEPVGNSYEISGKISWELDLWGRIARANEAALAQLTASEETRRALLLSLVSDVAAGYVRLLELDNELLLIGRTVASRRDTLALMESKYAGGGIPELPVLKARSDVEQLLAEIPAKEGEVIALEHSLSALLGHNPGPIARGGRVDALLLPTVPGGLPADLLARRPDVRKAEQDLVAANARIGVAKAQYLPNIPLTAQSGFASADLSNLTLLSSNFGTFGIALLGPVFTSGRISGQVREAEALQRQMATTYVATVQTALREVEDALAARRQAHLQMLIRGRQLKALTDIRDSAQKRYDGGYTAYTEVLDAERGVYAGELQQSQTRRDQFVALIGVYKAMGGGLSTVERMASSDPLPAKTTHE